VGGGGGWGGGGGGGGGGGVYLFVDTYHTTGSKFLKVVLKVMLGRRRTLARSKF